MSLYTTRNVIYIAFSLRHIRATNSLQPAVISSKGDAWQQPLGQVNQYITFHLPATLSIWPFGAKWENRGAHVTGGKPLTSVHDPSSPHKPPCFPCPPVHCFTESETKQQENTTVLLREIKIISYTTNKSIPTTQATLTHFVIYEILISCRLLKHSIWSPVLSQSCRRAQSQWTYYFWREDEPLLGPHVTFQLVQAVGGGAGGGRVSHAVINNLLHRQCASCWSLIARNRRAAFE